MHSFPTATVTRLREPTLDELQAENAILSEQLRVVIGWCFDVSAQLERERRAQGIGQIIAACAGAAAVAILTWSFGS